LGFFFVARVHRFIQSAENLRDRSLEDIGLAPHGQDFFDAVKPFWEP
jgi:hypothetical protein